MPDQRFGKIAGLLARHQVLQTPSEFASAVRIGLGPCPKGRNLHVSEMAASRDWKHWLESLGLQIQGLAGGAHSIRLIRRRGRKV